MSIAAGVAGAPGGMDIWVLVLIPGMAGMGRFVWAQVESVTDRTSGRTVVVDLRSMGFFLLKRSVIGRQRENTLQAHDGQRGRSDSKG
ncbi:MAG: hypothetical protein ABI286_05320 [Edaphobacter sp.]